ncbi:beta-galactosidase [Kitasatospora sp. NPDC056327]|uniref:beta-galactosidase n=1 Tax=Kitasatospora sp. NPDC056327 TaxID=3345785 RepID=UPI0035DE6B55
MRPRFRDGTLWLDGRPRFLITGEYPYYRDHPGRWAAKLRAVRASGIEVVSSYVPWRHHEIGRGDGRRWCFDGDGNRDLAGFLELVAAAGLLAVLKPGPYVHAELPFGGLPDRLSPTLDPRRSAARSADGRPLACHGFELPAALDPGFLADATDWLRAVGLFLRPFAHPDGPVVAAQIGNEGHYGESALPIDALDYSRPGTEGFAGSAPGVAVPVRAEDRPSAEGLRSLVSWGRWSAESLTAGMARLAGALGPDLAVFTTCAPPARADRTPGRAAGRYDAWLVRNRIGAPPALPRAYTAWTGPVTSDEEALVNYVLAARSGTGPAIEENWGLSWAEPGCAFPVVPVHHTLLGVACGATGISVYPACATDGWGPHLAVDPAMLPGPAVDRAPFDPPYGDAAPIGPDAGPGPALAALRVLTHFLAGRQEALALARPEPGVCWGVQPPYAAIGAWERRAGAGRTVPSAAGTLVPFVAHCLRRNLPFRLAELTGRTGPDPASEPLATVSGRFLDRAVQRRLARFAEQGGALLLVGELPALDEDLRPWTELADAARRHAGGRVRTVAAGERWPATAVEDWLGGVHGGGTPSGRGDGAHGVPVRARPGPWLELRTGTGDPGEAFVFLFNRTGSPLRARTVCGGHVVSADLVGGGCAAVQVSRGRLGACYVKGLNERTGDRVPVRVRVGGDLLVSDRPCDLSALRRAGGFEVRTAAGPGEARVALPEAA